MSEDAQLLRQYLQDRSEAAFGELVRRHIDLVFSAALRVVGGDSHLAQDVTQMVFTDLARKAWGLPGGVVLPGWLYRHTCFTAAKAVRTERRRQAREQTAMEMRTLDEHTGPDWEALAPHLDEGLNELNAADRDAIVLRFLKQQDLRAVGAALGVSEDTAQKRVSRALEKLRGVLTRRGVALGAATIGSLMAAEAVKAAPAGLAVSVTASSLAAATTAGTGISLAIMKVMAMTKLQITLAGAVAIAAAVTPLVLQRQSLNQARQENDRMRTDNQHLLTNNQSLQAQVDQLAALTAENRRLSNLVAQAGGTPSRDAAQMSELLRLRNTVTRLQSDARTNSEQKESMADLLSGPAIKGMMKSSFAAMVDKTYAPFFAEAHLTPEQTMALKELIANKQSTNLDRGMSLLSDKTDAAKRIEISKQQNDDQASYNEQVKQLLGEDGAARLNDFEKALSERMTVNTFETQLPEAWALSSDQKKQLIDAMVEERQNFRYTTSLPSSTTQPLNVASLYSEDHIKQQVDDQQRLGQQFLSRAKDILSPDQLKIYEQCLSNQQQMQAASLEMAAKMFAPK